MSDPERYSRHILLAEIGREGQGRLLSSRVAVIGCGAVGTVIASSLVRAGVGYVRVVDRDYIELSNLQRQILFDEEDIVRGLPKAIAAAEKLRRINSHMQVEPLVADVNATNVEQIISDVDLIPDGTDNFEARFLINDACVKHGIPWVYGAATATYGMSTVIIPHQTPCFRCFLAEMPVPGTVPTCDMVGVLGPAVSIIASLQVIEGLKLLMGPEEELHSKLIYLDAWNGELERIAADKGAVSCPTCDLGQFEFLEAREGSYVTSLCGREAVQVNLRRGVQVSFPQLAARLESVGEVSFNQYMLWFRVDSYQLTLFPDGRVIIKGTADESLARTLFARYVGL